MLPPKQISLLLGLLLTGAAVAQAPEADIARIVDIGKNQNQVMRHLRELTNMGPRLTGSPGLLRAERWAMAKFKRYGLQNVHLDQWGEVSVGFERGPNQVGRMVSPTTREFQFTTMNWMPGTRRPTTGGAAKEPASMEKLEKVKDSLKGKWLLMRARSTMRGPNAPANRDLYDAISKTGILGRVYAAADDRVHSSGRWAGKTYEKRPTELEIVIRKSDFDVVEANLDQGRNPQLYFDIQNRWIKGPIPQYNVIADIPGTEKPDEFVIVCGHIDSWNSPGSQGSMDNGTGVVNAIEAARILMAAGVKPKRTIRFILWGGEEQGLLGSRAYVEKYKAQMPKISAVLNDDGGTNYQGGYVGMESMKAMMEAAFAPTVRAFPDLPMRFDVRPDMPRGGSSDHAPFVGAGVPGFFTIEAGRADYGFVWHTQNDRYENAIPEYLVQSSTNHAVVSYNLAMADTLLARVPPAPARTSVLDVVAGGMDRYHPEEEHDHSSHKGCNHDADYVWSLVFKNPQWMRMLSR